MKILMVTLCSLFIISSGANVEQEYQETIQGWYGNAGTSVSESTWKNAVTWFINTCAGGGQCSGCLLAVVENNASGTGEMWLGTFDQSGPRTILTTPVGLRVDRTDSQKRRLARDGQCHRGGTGIRCSGATCVGVGEGAHWEGRDLTAHATHYANILNTSPGDITHYIYQYFSLQTSDSQEIFHDGYIRRTLGCITQPLEQQIQMCEGPIAEANGVYLYSNINNSLGSENATRAAQTLRDRPNWCNTLSSSSITRVTSYAGPGTVFQEGGSAPTNIAGNQPTSPSNVTVSTQSSSTGGGSSILLPLLGAGAIGTAIYLSQDDDEEEEDDSGPTYSAGTDLQPGNSITGDHAVLSGSERFRECQALSTTAYSADISSVRDGGEVTGRYQLADESGSSAALYGPGQNQLQASLFDNMDHDCIVQAAADGRSTAFVSGDSPLEEYVQQAAEEGRDPNEPLTLEGDEEERNSPVRSITPVAGLSQTIDNEGALNVADANLEMDMAEHALFQRNEQEAIDVFNAGAESFTQSADKQAEAASFANIGTDQALQTAVRIRDFHGNKADALTDHLNEFTTRQTALANCRRTYDQYRDQHPVWDRAMAKVLPMGPSGLYQPPTYDGDRCEKYLQWQSPYMFKNQHVVKEVSTIVEDSIEIVDGMNEVIGVLDNRKLNEVDVSKAFKHPVWKKVAARESFLEKCAKTSCFEKRQNKLYPLTRYKGF